MSDKIDAALQNLLEALRLAPNNPECYLNLGKFYYFQGQLDTAIPLFEKSLRIDPEGWDAHYMLGNAFTRRNQIHQAAEQYLAAVTINPHYSNAKLNLALTYVNLCEYEHALPYLTEAATLDPSNAELQGHLAVTLLNLGKSKEALDQFALACQLDPTRSEWHHNLAVLYMRDQQNDMAQIHFSKVLELDPDNSTAKHLLAALAPERDHKPDSAPSEYVSSLFDQYSDYYNAHMRETLKYNVPVLMRQTIGKIIGLHKPQQNILDLGCGTGLCGVYFRDLAGFLIGVDLSYGMLQEAQRLGAYDGLCQCNILEIVPGFGRAVFDIALAADVLVYIGDVRQVFSTVRSILRPEGIFAFSIEVSESSKDFELLSTGRFAHNAEYINNLAAEHDFKVMIDENIMLRKNNDQTIFGKLFVLSASANKST